MQNDKSAVQGTETLAKKSGEFLIGDDLPVTRLGFGAMRITGDGPPRRRNAIMAANKSKAELEAEIDDLKDENAELQDQLDAVADIVAPADEDEDENGTADDEQEDQD